MTWWKDDDGPVWVRDPRCTCIARTQPGPTRQEDPQRHTSVCGWSIVPGAKPPEGDPAEPHAPWDAAATAFDDLLELWSPHAD